MLVLYDAACPLCRSLADFMQRKLVTTAVSFQAWQDFNKAPDPACPAAELEREKQQPEQLRVWTGTQLLAGTQAWLALVHAHPHLQGLNWLAAKLHLTPQLGQSLQWAGSSLRRFCRACKSRPPRKPAKINV